MIVDNETTRPTATLAVEVTPGDVDAGAEMRLTAALTCAPPADLSGRTIQIRDGDGAVVGSAEFSGFDGATSTTEAFAITAPVATGDHVWSAVATEHVAEDLSWPELSAPVRFTVRPHATSVVVWGVPSAIEPGQRFGIKVGAKCACGCRAAGWSVAIRDGDGATVATVVTGDAPWPGTAALYVAEVECEASGAEGLSQWVAELAAPELEIAHAARSTAFGVRLVPPPACLVTVQAVDAKSQAPVQGAKVVIHPYRGVTDDRGVAEMRVPRGAYKVFVGGKAYVPFAVEGEVTKDMTIRAELALDAGPTIPDTWA
jgi:hypothetical protein